jgi:ABC-2 type transport system permease protein
MVVSFIAVGLLPLVSGWENLAKAFPWYYYQGSDPVTNGIDWVDIAVLVACIVVFTIVAVVGVNRRDLKGHSVGVSMLDRLRANRFTHTLAEKFAGTARVSKIWIKTASDYQGLLLIVSMVIFLIAIIVGPMYGLIDQQIKTLGASLPDAMVALFGGGDMSTFEGFYQIEVFGLMAPMSVMAVTIAIGAGALAGEEKRNTMGLLLANPVKRSTIVIEKAVTMVLYGSIVGFATYLGTAAGATIGNLGMSLWNVAAMCLLVTLLGLAFGALSLALGAATGRVQVAVFGTIGVAFVTYLLNAFLPLSQSLSDWAKVSPFWYYLGGDPLLEGLDWVDATVLGVLTLVLFAASIALFSRRDLRARG